MSFALGQVRVDITAELELWLGLRLNLGLGLIFYVYFVSTKPTVLSSCVIGTSQVAYE